MVSLSKVSRVCAKLIPAKKNSKDIQDLSSSVLLDNEAFVQQVLRTNTDAKIPDFPGKG
ncbi:hypothetical protein DOY81_010101 [Sarcophaga bullata]|nr:hypothetical protein DOY81_010101 [Sarcophaga bullata]